MNLSHMLVLLDGVYACLFSELLFSDSRLFQLLCCFVEEEVPSLSQLLCCFVEEEVPSLSQLLCCFVEEEVPSLSQLLCCFVEEEGFDVLVLPTFVEGMAVAEPLRSSSDANLLALLSGGTMTGLGVDEKSQSFRAPP